MKSFTFYGRCFGCKRDRFFLRPASIPFPGNKRIIATSQDEMCGECIRKVRKVLT